MGLNRSSGSVRSGQVRLVINKFDTSISSHSTSGFNFLKNGPIPASFFIFLSFSHYNFNNTKYKSIVGVLGIRTPSCRMVGADDTTELWRLLAASTYLIPFKIEAGMLNVSVKCVTVCREIYVSFLVCLLFRNFYNL